MKTRIIKYIRILMLFVFITSCSTNEYDTPYDKEENIVEFALNITSDTPTKGTVIGDDALNENLINRLDIMFFDGQAQRYYAKPDIATDYNPSTGKVKLTFSRDQLGLFDNLTNYTLLVLANTTIPSVQLDGKSYDAVRALTEQANFTGNVNPQPAFLMDGTVTTKLSFASATIPDVNMKRAAAKIHLLLSQASVNDHTALSAQVMMVNYIDKTSITDGLPYSSSVVDYKNTGYRSVSLPGQGSAFQPFYSYENDWEYNTYKQPYLLIKINWKNNSTSDLRDGYYIVPFNYLNSSENSDQLAFKLLRNTVYNINASISTLGGSSPETPETLGGNFVLADWTTNAILGDFISYHYMVVHELYMDIYNTNTRSIGYSSSLPVQISNVKAYCYEYDVNGAQSTKNYVSGNPEFPLVTIDANNAKINVSTAIPVNYVPKYISFTVSTIGSPTITQQVVINQYPPIYVTATQSTDLTAGATNGTSNNPGGAPGQTNFNFFKITTVVQTGNYYVGDPRTYNGNTMTTGTDLQTNNLRSPQFVIASQRGITGSYSYALSQGRCQTYKELPYDRGVWRMPTMAEVLLIDLIQDDARSAVKKLLIGPAYWSAYKYAYYDFGSNTFTYGNSNSSAYIRCVTDTWML